MDRILKEHQDAAPYENTDPLPVEAASPPNEGHEQKEHVENPEVKTFHIRIKNRNDIPYGLIIS
jgi:hypothetical protein